MSVSHVEGCGAAAKAGLKVDFGGDAGQPECAASLDGRGSAGRTVCGLPLDRLRARGLCVRSIGEGTGWRAVCSARRARSSGARRSVRPRVAPNEPCRLRQKASSH